MDTGARQQESPRIFAEIYRSIGSIESTLESQSGVLKQQGKKLDDIYTAIYVGNGKKGIINWLTEHEGKLGKLLGQSKDQKKHSLKVAGYSTGALTALVLALKLIAFLLTGHWPTVP